MLTVFLTVAENPAGDKSVTPYSLDQKQASGRAQKKGCTLEQCIPSLHMLRFPKEGGNPLSC